jgi:putative peptide zinc metalloprotease protein
VPVDRPTFSESWYRVSDLRPRLRSTVQAHRQYFRGNMWHVIQDPSSNQFFRLNEAAYRFVALLDGRRTVADAWKIASEQLGDDAPTQGEAIQLLGQLYTSNLLAGDMPPDAEGLFKRYRKRVTREVQSYLMNILFIRIPIFDPERLLERTVGFLGAFFSWWGGLLWLGLIATGLYFLAGRTSDLMKGAEGILSPERLPLLYVSFVIIKVCHEFGHAFACKKFGRDAGTGGEVHIMGIMFLVFTPLPYVDASSSWALRSKWHRTVVGAAGMYVEMALAAVAAIVWARTPEGATIHAIAYNAMFVGSVSTVLFNANPLLRYDGYYMLSDLLEIPNLQQRGRDFLYYLVKQYVWGVRKPRNPAHTGGEKFWLFTYAIFSTAYRIFISIAIFLFVANALPVVGAILAAVAVVVWGFVPLGKFVYYIISSNELMRVRSRAVITSLLVPAAILAGLGLIPAPDRFYIEGVVEPSQMQIVHAGADGFLREFLPSGRHVTPDGLLLARSENPSLAAQKAQLAAERRELVARRGVAIMKEPAAVQIIDEQIDALGVKIRRIDKQLADLDVRAPLAGTWVAPTIDLALGAYLKRGQDLGLVATMDDLVVRAIALHDTGGILAIDSGDRVTMRILKRPDQEVAGTVKCFLPAGQKNLPSPALGYPAGGSIAVTADDRSGTKAAERVFEIRIIPDPSDRVQLLAGQRVMVRFDASRKPYLMQLWRSILQMLQRRFHI